MQTAFLASGNNRTIPTILDESDRLFNKLKLGNRPVTVLLFGLSDSQHFMGSLVAWIYFNDRLEKSNCTLVPGLIEKLSFAFQRRRVVGR